MRRLPRIYYTLLGKVAVPCDDHLEWALWFNTAERRIARTIVGPMTVSTVFLGMDHGFDGDPLLFETMIFNGDAEDIYVTRCSTWGEAEAMHTTAVSWAEARLSEATASTDLSHDHQ